MKNRFLTALLLMIFMSLGILLRPQNSSAQTDPQQKLAQEVIAIFQTKCVDCHSAGGKAGFDIRTRASLLKGGNRGAAIIPGKAQDSLLMKYISGEKSPRMPLGDELDEEQIEAIEKWINQGAIWPETYKPVLPPSSTIKEKSITPEHRKYWAFVAPQRPAIPNIANQQWVKNPIDSFILAALEQKNLSPSRAADKATLLRRITYDLTGLPPTPEEIQTFLTDQDANALEKVIDRLLASPRYGERWAQHWLDVVRFGETNGFELDAERPQAWRYRDYVVKAFQTDKPFNLFIQEQIAGDELFPRDFEAHVATGFLRAGPQHVVAGNLDKAELRQEYLTETMLGIGSGIMGLTVGCARCHDHKFDPILQSDFYKMQAFFAATDNAEFAPATEAEQNQFSAALETHNQKLKPIKAAIAAIEKPFEEKIKAERKAKLELRYRTALEIPRDKRTPEQKEDARYAERMLEVKYEDLLAVMPPETKSQRAALRQKMHALAWEEPVPLPKALAVADRIDPMPATYVFKGGEVHNPIREVVPEFPKVLQPENTAPPTIKALSIDGGKQSSGRRTVLAKWLGSDQNPLTARVYVNRVWQHHFGVGLVATPNDFGKNGSGVTNQKLLDWLATEFIASGWSVKKLHKLMLLSNTYQQASAIDVAKQKIDPENKLLWRANRQRLDAEAIRDAILAANGSLTEQIGGPSVRVPLEPEVVETIFTEYEPDNLWPVHPDPKQHTRRSLYLLRKRNVKLPMLVAFDTPDLQTSCGARNVSVHSLQALTMINSEFMLAQSKELAQRILSEASSFESRLDQLYLLTLGRKPRIDERNAAQQFLTQQVKLIASRQRAKADIVKIKQKPKNIDDATGAAWVDLCLATLNLNEFIYLN